MGRKRKKHSPPNGDAGLHPFIDWGWTLLWCAILAALIFVPDQKILRYKLLAVEAGIAALWLTILARWAAAEGARWQRTPLDIPVAAYGLSGVVFYLLSPEKGASTLELTRILFSTATFFAATQTLPLLQKPERVFAFWTLGAALAGLYAVLQRQGGWWIIGVPQLDRPIATFGNPIFFAAFLAPSALIGVGLALSKQGASRWVLFIASGLAALGAVLTQTRAAVAGLALAVLAAALILLEGRRRWAVVGVTLAAGIAAIWIFKDRAWTHGLIWRDTLKIWFDHPVFGCGLGRFHIEFPPYASEALRARWPEARVIINFAHNEYLQVLAETGVVGLALLAATIIATLRWLATDWSALDGGARKRWTGGLALAGMALLGQNVFSPDMRFGLSSFTVFLCLAGCVGIVSSRAVPFAPFPGRYALAIAGLAAITSWGRLAAAPLSAQRRLAATPDFHVSGDPQFDETVGRLEAELKKSPDNPDFAEHLAYLYAKKKDWPRAIEKFEIVARLAPKRPGPLNNLGNVYYSIGNRGQAILYWKRSLKVDPSQIDAHINLGKALYEVGKLKEAGHYIQEVLRRDPDNEKAQILLKKMIE